MSRILITTKAWILMSLEGCYSNGSRPYILRRSRSDCVCPKDHLYFMKFAHPNITRWNSNKQAEGSFEQDQLASDTNGFGSLSRRQMIKPVIAAVVGGAYGGGMEIILNCDLVVASDTAKFALPEVKRGVVAIAGGQSRQCSLLLLSSNGFIVTGIPRLSHIAGHQVRSQRCQS